MKRQPSRIKAMAAAYDHRIAEIERITFLSAEWRRKYGKPRRSA